MKSLDTFYENQLRRESLVPSNDTNFTESLLFFNWFRNVKGEFLKGYNKFEFVLIKFLIICLLKSINIIP